MRKKFTQAVNSQALLLSKEVLELLDVPERGKVEVQVLGSVMLVGSAKLNKNELRASLAFASSVGGDAIYRRLS